MLLNTDWLTTVFLLALPVVRRNKILYYKNKNEKQESTVTHSLSWDSEGEAEDPEGEGGDFTGGGVVGGTVHVVSKSNGIYKHISVVFTSYVCYAHPLYDCSFALLVCRCMHRYWRELTTSEVLLSLTGMAKQTKLRDHNFFGVSYKGPLRTTSQHTDLYICRCKAMSPSHVSLSREHWIWPLNPFLAPGNTNYKWSAIEPLIWLRSAVKLYNK